MRTSPTGKKAGRSAFTLIELLVVLVGVLIVAAAIVPALRGAGRRGDLDGAAARVAASARFAREAAAARRATVALTVETAPAAVRLTVEEADAGASPAGGPDLPAAPAPLPPAFAAVRLPPGVTARFEPAPETADDGRSGGTVEAVRFPPDGRTAGGTVVLAGSRGRECRILVTPGTGLVRLLPGGE